MLVYHQAQDSFNSAIIEVTCFWSCFVHACHLTQYDAMWQHITHFAHTHTHSPHFSLCKCLAGYLPFSLHNRSLVYTYTIAFLLAVAVVELTSPSQLSYSTSLVGLLKLYVTYASYVLLLSTYVGTVGTLLKLTFRPLVDILKVNHLMFI